ncbi:hypothetical protein F4801DRAFT_402430 [Xylaria longipes]|nr:hypothetical protein F4801DRAFT_402430 [Xylaria longipes]
MRSQIASPDQSFYAFYDPSDCRGLRLSVDQLTRFVENDGPFDGVVGFPGSAILMHEQSGCLAFQWTLSEFRPRISRVDVTAWSVEPTGGQSLSMMEVTNSPGIRTSQNLSRLFGGRWHMRTQRVNND